jgi:asparagine synthase (glutamine-hydrolysing)
MAEASRVPSLARGLLSRVTRRSPQRADLEAELAATRSRLRRSRRRHQSAWAEVLRLRDEVKKLRADRDRLKRELRATRASLRHPFPDHATPSAEVARTIEQVLEEKLTYLSRENLEMLAAVVAEAERAERPGLVVEAGTALGGAAIVMAAAKAASRPMRVYDVFGQIPPPSERDGDDVHQRYRAITAGEARGVAGTTYYGYRQDLHTEVQESFARCGRPVEDNSVELVKGLFADTLVLDEPVAFAHVDGDWYESTMTCLERLCPLLSVGGRIVLDDYYAWSGCAAAVEEYFADRPGYRLERRARLHVVRL